jgi:hypothetical protein
MLIEQVDGLNLEPLERTLDGLPDVRWATIEGRRTLHPAGIETRIEVEPEFGGNRQVFAERREGFTDEFFIDEQTINLGGIEKGDPTLHGGPKQRRHLLSVFGWAVREAHPHAA